MISARKLSKSYGKIKALHEVSLQIDSREICGILGPNGAGKSTLFKVLCGLVTPDSGTFEIRSSRSKSIGAIIEKPALFEYLSASKNLSLLSGMQGAPQDHQTITNLLELVGISPERKDPVGNFSLGMKQRLGIATALINDPDCLILDEPFLGLDPIAANSLGELIKTLAHDKKLAILISSHLLGELIKTCDTLKILRDGSITKTGTTTDILKSTTEKYIIRGINLDKSAMLRKMQIPVSPECVSLELGIKDAPGFLKKLMEEGNEISYFGPEMNINELYGKA
jgi:ABC-type multidrug transport system ATPase subunit